jgi:hypothetical protein
MSGDETRDDRRDVLLSLYPLLEKMEDPWTELAFELVDSLTCGSQIDQDASDAVGALYTVMLLQKEAGRPKRSRPVQAPDGTFWRYEQPRTTGEAAHWVKVDEASPPSWASVYWEALDYS